MRALTGTSFKSDEKRFAEMAEASAALARAYIQLYNTSTSAATATSGAAAAPAGPGAVRELAAARMHLRGVLKQCEGTFGEHAKWAEMDALLREVTALEEAALARAKGQ